MQVAQRTSIVPFSRGDMAGKRDVAIQDASTQAALQVPGSTREKLYKLQAAIGALPEIECPLQHVFAPGVYARTIYIPQGGVLVGKIHKHKHLNILSQGAVFVMTEGGGTEHLIGPLTMVSEPGTKRAVHALTDVVWTTIHLVESTDLAEIEDQVIAKSYAEYEQFVLEDKSTREVEL